MKTKRAILIGVAAAAVVAAIAVSCGGSSNTQTATSTQTASASATATHPVTPTAMPTYTATPSPFPNVCQTNPSPATSDQTVVSQPQPGDQVTSPVTVSGQINAFEAQFNIAIKDASGTDIATVPDVFSSQGQTLAPFSTSVPFTVASQTSACLWVYDVSQMSGLPIQVVQVPITLVP